MASTTAQRQVTLPATPQLRVIPGFGGGPPPSGVRQPPVSNAQLAILILIAFETMMFVGLMTAYFVLRAGSLTWPPHDLPRLPLAVTWVNTAVLSFSAFTMWRAVAAVRHDRCDAMRSALLATAVLGTGFVVVQGTEWIRLIHQGLTLTSSVYGATFYTLIGLHALHVVAAVVWLLVVLRLAYRGRYSARNYSGVAVCGTYWYFVCALWLVLFGVVYLH